jgi:hypothetical protein
VCVRICVCLVRTPTSHTFPNCFLYSFSFPCRYGHKCARAHFHHCDCQPLRRYNSDPNGRALILPCVQCHLHSHLANHILHSHTTQVVQSLSSFHQTCHHIISGLSSLYPRTHGTNLRRGGPRGTCTLSAQHLFALRLRRQRRASLSTSTSISCCDEHSIPRSTTSNGWKWRTPCQWRARYLVIARFCAVWCRRECYVIAACRFNDSFSGYDCLSHSFWV